MVNKFVLEEYEINQEEIQRELEEIIGGDSLEKIEAAFDISVKKFDLGTILKGRILGIIGNNVILDTGYKSEGTIPLSEFDSAEDVEIGNEIEVMLESFEDDTGLIQISKRKADRIRGWEKVVDKYKGKVDFIKNLYDEVKFIFDKPIDFDKQQKEAKTLFVGLPSEFPSNIKILKIVYYLNGEPAIYIVSS